MANNSTNINKTDNHLSSQKTMTYDIGNLGPGLGQAQTCGTFKTVNGIPTLPCMFSSFIYKFVIADICKIYLLTIPRYCWWNYILYNMEKILLLVVQ